MIADVLGLLVVPAFLVVLAAVVSWCTSRDGGRTRRPRRGGRHRGWWRPDDGGIYPATPYLRRLTRDNGWRGQLVHDRHGEPVAIIGSIGDSRVPICQLMLL